MEKKAKVSEQKAQEESMKFEDLMKEMKWTQEKKDKELNNLKDQLKDLKNEYDLLKLQKIVEQENSQRRNDKN